MAEAKNRVFVKAWKGYLLILRPRTGGEAREKHFQKCGDEELGG